MTISSSSPSRLLLLLGLLLSLALASSARALDPTRSMEKYSRRTWGLEQGLTSGRVNAIAQTPDGYLWIGTDENLLRFDGVRFTAVQPPPGTLEHIDHILSLTVDTGGALWIRTQDSRLLRYHGGHFAVMLSRALGDPGVTAVTPASIGGLLAAGLSHGVMNVAPGLLQRIPIHTPSLLISIAETKDGRIWVGTRETGLFAWKDSVLTPITQGIPDAKINCLLATDSGQLWIGTDNGLALWDPRTGLTHTVPSAFDHLRVLAMVQDRHGNLWAGTSSGLLRFNSSGASWLPRASQDRGTAISALVEDREGDLWYGDGAHLARLRDSPLITFGDPDQPGGDQFGAIYVDAHRRTWIAPLSGGLFWMRDGVMHPVSVAGLAQDVIYSIDGQGDDLWIARQEGGLTRLRGEGDQWTATTWTRAQGLSQDRVFVARATRDGSIFAATLTAGVDRLTPHGLSHLGRSDGLLSDTVTAIEQDQDGVVWFGTPDGVSTWKDRTLQAFAMPQGLPSSNVISLLADASGGMWIGTSRGLVFAEHGHIHTFDSPLLNHTAILGMAIDRQDRLWLSTTSRILSLPREALLGHHLQPEMVRSYGLPDGLRSTEGVLRSRSVVHDPLGQVWISTNRGLAMTTLTTSGLFNLPAIPHVETVLIDGTPTALEGDTLHVPAGTRRISFGYAGLDLRASERVRFCYRLDGFDRQWSRPVEEREAAYTNLPPGQYRFRVIASNSNGEWNSQESTLSFRVDPMFWQHWEFQLLVVGALLLIFVWIYRARMQYMITQANMRFEERLIERTRIARELHDTLLQGFISAVLHLNLTADRLESGSPILSSLQNSLRVMEKVIDQARDAVKGLRTFDGASQDLEQVFHDLFHEIEGESDAVCEVHLEGDRVDLRPAVLEDVCLIGREAVINASRHAQASRIVVVIRYSRGNLELEVRDNGCGMDPSTASRGREGHWGLLGMRERASRLGSRLQILSRPGAGTRVVLTIAAPVAFSSQGDKPVRISI